MRDFPQGEQQLRSYLLVQHGNVEAIDQPLYDTVPFPRGTWVDKLEFFRVTVGMEGKTWLETNGSMPSSLPQPQGFFISGFSLSVLEPEAPAAEIMRGALFEFVIGSKLYFKLPASALFTLPEGALYGYQLRQGLGLLAQQNFLASLYWPRPMSKKRDVSYSIRVQLNGTLFRPLV